MKKLCLLVSVSMVVILGFAAITWAQEVSVFDEAQKIIIRAFITPGDACPGTPPSSCYSAFLEVRDSDGITMSRDNLVVTGTDLTPTLNPFKIHNNDLTNNDISMSIDNGTGTIYVFCTNTGLHVMKYNIAIKEPVIKVDPLSLAFGSVNVGDSLDRTVTVSNVGAALLTFTEMAISGTGFSPVIGGTCGTSLAAGADCTATVTFTPGAAGAASGTLSIKSDGGDANVSLTGTGATPPPSGYPDLEAGVGSLPGVYNAGLTVYIKASATNIGNARSGPFTIKAWLSSVAKPGGQLLFTFPSSGLDVGQSVNTGSIAVTPGAACAIHDTCYWIIKVDADNQVIESNEKNNTITHSVDRAR